MLWITIDDVFTLAKSLSQEIKYFVCNSNRNELCSLVNNEGFMMFKHGMTIIIEIEAKVDGKLSFLYWIMIKWLQNIEHQLNLWAKLTSRRQGCHIESSMFYDFMALEMKQQIKVINITFNWQSYHRQAEHEDKSIKLRHREEFSKQTVGFPQKWVLYMSCIS